MAITLHNLQPARGSRRRKIRVGRGNASGRGTYSTRGQKGQRARSGGRSGLKLKGLKRRLLNLPKIGGFKSRYSKLAPVNISALNEHFKDGERVTLARLWQLGLVDNKMQAKILGDGELKKKLVLAGLAVSESARKKIEEAGGSVTAIVPKPHNKKNPQ